MAFLDPYAIDGATITAGQLRRQVYATTKGATGVDGPGDLTVVAVPGSPGVAGIMPGGGVIGVQSRRESYSVTNPVMDGDALVEVPTAGSSGATHYVIVEVTDPEYHGQESEAGATPLVVSSLSGRARPFLPLARIELEDGETFGVTSTVVDLRQVANPLKERYVRTFQLNVAHTEQLGGTNAARWPDISQMNDVPVPEWATRMNVIAHWGTVRSDGTARGHVWVRMTRGGNHTDTQPSRWQAPEGEVQRFGINYGAWRAVPEELRGQTVSILMMGQRIDGPPVTADGYTSITLDVEFVESAI